MCVISWTTFKVTTLIAAVARPLVNLDHIVPPYRSECCEDAKSSNSSSSWGSYCSNELVMVHIHPRTYKVIFITVTPPAEDAPVEPPKNEFVPKPMWMQV